MVPNEMRILPGSDLVLTEEEEAEPYDVFYCMDFGTADRIGRAVKYYDSAKKTFCIDHHASSDGVAQVNHIVPLASSTCEVLYNLLDAEYITSDVAKCLYLGIVHDTGVFKYPSTTEETMRIAGHLITLGANPQAIIDGTFYEKTFLQTQILGRCLLESILLMNGKVIVSYVTRKIMTLYEVGPEDLTGVIERLRITKGVEVAILLREDEPHVFKVSLRSINYIDVCKIAVAFGGGGHYHASGCSISGSVHDVINTITESLETQFIERGLL
jgi:phosphoesterase RecJ-like protein